MPPTSLSTNLQRARGGGEYLFAGPSVTTAKEERKKQGWRNSKEMGGPAFISVCSGNKGVEEACGGTVKTEWASLLQAWSSYQFAQGLKREMKPRLTIKKFRLLGWAVLIKFSHLDKSPTCFDNTESTSKQVREFVQDFCKDLKNSKYFFAYFHQNLVRWPLND